ncbi:threonyl-tRNA synthetase [Jimgerdemannia flammicorona]|uniref:threonine--tRNA ligase n=1 Tax=Jimgerdemannia flammicorona TaxID=994334 RepID=A0A433Q8B0_9FUNG|nr:threonyl-tRNA synthetase [Jimgerdemannia flammicorona]
MLAILPRARLVQPTLPTPAHARTASRPLSTFRPFRQQQQTADVKSIPIGHSSANITQSATTLAQISSSHEHDDDPTSRDHRHIGRAQSLFMIHPLSPGSIFMLPHGTRIVHRLQDFLRREYRRYGYEEVMTPLIYKKDLWETSGHWQNYKEDMFLVRGGDEGKDETDEQKHGHGHDGHYEHEHSHTEKGAEEYALKPMNCPGHCLIFDSTPRSWRDLPIRLADFSPLHRNEASGALSGLTRIRRFHQDDAHIFCTESQILPEITACLSFVDRVYSTFHFPHYDLTLSTRPETNFIGTPDEWHHAETSLTEALDTTGRPWTLKPGDGAFYGPKIDIMVKDILGRTHQTATIQLDFQLPRRFGLRYVDEQNRPQTPVIVHRAILGSVERMLAILIEHTGGRWPFWLSPRQAIVIPVATQFAGYAEEVARRIGGEGRKDEEGGADADLERNPESATRRLYYVDADTSPRDRLNKMIRDAQLAQYNFILVVGQKEVDAAVVNVRTRDGNVLGTMTVKEVRDMFTELTKRFE